MILTLKNFRCYEHETFDLGEQGLTLIMGESGCGKSTIMCAVNFALYGLGTKLATYGKTSCAVELRVNNDFHIVRTRRPNRLVVNNKYEDDAAQAIINQKFGDHFGISGYIQQNATSSFLHMSAPDKLVFLETLLFETLDIDQVKDNIKKNIQMTKTDLVNVSAKFEMATKMLADLETPDMSIDFPIRCKKSQRELAIKNIHTKIKNNKTLTRRAQRTRERLVQQISDVKLFLATYNIHTDAVTKARDEAASTLEKLDALPNVSQTDVDTLKSALARVLETAERRMLESRLTSDTQTLEQMKQSETLAYKKILDSLKESLWKNEDRDEASETKKDYVEFLKDVDRTKALVHKRASLKSSLDDISSAPDYQEKTLVSIQEYEQTIIQCNRMIEEAKQRLVCPACTANLRVSEGALVKFNTLVSSNDSVTELKSKLSEVKRLLSEHKNKLQRYEVVASKISDVDKELEDVKEGYEDDGDALNDETTIEDAKRTIEHLDTYVRENNTREKELVLKTELFNTGKYFSETYSAFKQKIVETRRRIDILHSTEEDGENTSDTKSEDALRDEIAVLTQTVQERSVLLQIIERCEKDEKFHTAKITESEKRLSDKHSLSVSSSSNYETLLGDLQKDVDACNIEISTRANDKIKLDETEQQLKLWEENERVKNIYTKWKTECETLKELEDDKKEKYKAAIELKEIILETECDMLHDMINTINTHVQMYLDRFFPEHPITINLRTFKVVKATSKPQITLEINYKGMECELSTLSGGEVSRVVLAYTLGFAEMFSTPLLMLDECTASLDEDTVTNVIETIKDECGDKLCVVIAHQTVSGVFDKVISL